MTDQQPTSSLAMKIAQIMGELTRIPKGGKNTHFNYAYVEEGDVADTIRAKLAERHIAFFASMTRWHQEPAGNGIKTICDFEFQFVDADTGEVKTLPWSGEANDAQDKGMSKAATSAEKYFLLKTFMLSTGKKEADPDSGPRERQEHPANAPQRATTNGSGNQAQPSTDPHIRALGEAWPMVADLYSEYKDLNDGKRTFMADVKILEESGKLAAGCTDAKAISTAVHLDLMTPARGGRKAS